MALQQATLQELRNLTFALIGREYSQTSAAYARINALWNNGARMAHRKSNYWERYYTVGEPRTITSNYIESTEDSLHVYGAGTDAVNGLYQRNGTINGVAAYTLYDTDGTTELYSLVADGIGGDGFIVEGDPDENNPILYEGGLEGVSYNEYPTSEWLSDEGESPAPRLEALSDIEVFLRIYDSEPFTKTGASEYAFIVKNGIAYVNKARGNTAYVTYKRRLDVNLSTDDDVNTEIPSEFMPYMAHYAAYTWQRSVDQNSDDANFGLSLAIVNQTLEDELAKIDSQNLFNTSVARRYKTHYNQLTI